MIRLGWERELYPDIQGHCWDAAGQILALTGHVPDFESSRQVLRICNSPTCETLGIPAEKGFCRISVTSSLILKLPALCNLWMSKGNWERLSCSSSDHSESADCPVCCVLGYFPGRRNLVFYNSVALIHLPKLSSSSGMTQLIHTGCFPCTDSPCGAVRLKKSPEKVWLKSGHLAVRWCLIEAEIN